jgi:hypothetical protein
MLAVLVAGCVPVQQNPQPFVGPPAAPAAYGARQITINGQPPNGAQLATLEQLEASYGVTLPAGHYWYDAKSGAFGRWGGPTEAVIAAGLDLGPPLPANASGGGTSIVINGREIHPAERAYLEYLIGAAIAPGRYFLDADGNAGVEGQEPTINLAVAAQQRRGGGGSRSIYGGTDHTGRASWFETDGKCRYIETPSGGFSSGCN